MISGIKESAETKKAEEIIRQSVSEFPEDCEAGINKSIRSIKSMRNFKGLTDYQPLVVSLRHTLYQECNH